MTADPRTAWAEQLSVPAGADPEAALAAFLRSLPGYDFLPPPERAAAVNALAAAAVPVGKDGTTERLLREEVDGFAARFWALDPADRRTEWAELVRRGAPAARLRALEPGLDVNPGPLADPAAGELAALVRELFLLPPRDRAIRRNTWLAARAGEADRWRAAFATVLAAAPALAALDGQLGLAFRPDSDLAALAGASAESEAGSGRPVSAGVADFRVRMRDYEEATAARRERAARRDRVYEEAAAARREKAARANPGIPGWLRITCGTLSIWMVVAGFRATITNRREPALPSRPPTPSYIDSPTAPSAAPSLLFRVFSVAEVANFERYERDRRGSPPADYATWVSAGRPVGLSNLQRFQTGFMYDRGQILQFQEYDRTKRGPAPTFYENWVKVGKPTEPGSYSLPPMTR